MLWTRSSARAGSEIWIGAEQKRKQSLWKVPVTKAPDNLYVGEAVRIPVRQRKSNTNSRVFQGCTDHNDRYI